jgi:hypothetical protein
MILPDAAYTRSGERVTSLEEHKGLIRGTVVTGERQDGEPMIAHRYYYPDGRMTPARETQHDLEIG